VSERELIRCQYCNRLFFYALTVASDGTKSMPIDPRPKPFEPVPDVAPNVILEPDGRARVLRKLELGNTALGPRYTTHWATCTYSRRMQDIREKRRRRLELEEDQLDELRSGR
jgi:hypothetical protein